MPPCTPKRKIKRKKSKRGSCKSGSCKSGSCKSGSCKSGSCKSGGKRRLNGCIKYLLCRLKQCKGTRVMEVAKRAGKEWCKLSPQEKTAWKNKK